MMIRTSHTRRAGLTLTEALVALFVASIGLIGLLALFPLGALQMAQALKDHRCTETATRFDAMLRTVWEQSLDNNTATYTTVRDAMLHRVPNSPPNSGNGQLRSYLGASRPVFIDPLGAAMSATSTSNIDPHCVGNRNPISLPLLYNPTVPLPLPPAFPTPLRDDYVFRVGLGPLTTAAARFAFCSLLDDVTFEEAGRPALEGGLSGSIERGGRYNAVGVVQRLRSNDLRLDFKVLVFDGRAASYMPDSNEQRFTQKPDPMNPALTVPLTFTTNQTQVTIVYAGEPPPIVKGRWVMLRTSGWSDIPETRDAMGNIQTPYWAAKAPVISFSRVVSVDAETPNQVTFELQTPIPAIHDVSGFNVPTNPLPAGVTRPIPIQEVVVLAGLAEVFDRPPLRMRN